MTGPRTWAAELVGTYAFVTIGAGAGIVAGAQIAEIGLLGVAAANGLGLAVMVTALMSISGAHLNPAITLSALLGRKIRSVDALGYVAAQTLGAVLAAVTLRTVFDEADWIVAGLGAPALGVESEVGLLAEAVFTVFLALVVWGTAIDERGPKVGGFAIGVTVFVGVLAIGPLTGGAFNPARYFGPAVILGDLSGWWVYVLGPAAGAAVVGLGYPLLFMAGGDAAQRR